MLVHTSGRVALVWFYEDVSGGHIGSASTTSTGKLQSAIDVGSAPKDGQLLDAEIAPDGSVWTVAGPSDGNGMQVSTGGGTTATNVSTPYPVGFAELALYRHNAGYRDTRGGIHHQTGRLHLRVPWVVVSRPQRGADVDWRSTRGSR